MQIVGVKELKNKLTHYLNLAKRGNNIVVTHRGSPVAILHNLENIGNEVSLEEKLAVLAKQGKIKLPLKKSGFLKKIQRPTIKGKLLSETVIEDRR